MTPPQPLDSLDIHNVLTHYRAGRWTPAQVAHEVLRRIEAYDDASVFISILPESEVLDAAARADEQLRAGKALPLLGIPFAIKDNIDFAGLPTTVGCPEFSYAPNSSATVVSRLVEAGAIPIGKTNLDQFATGLVGTRSPYGTPRNPFNPEYIPGGSSSGSAVAVSAGLVSFALGTDTAGSGRVPAAFTNIIGLKPTRGRLSTAGVVPACRSLDCVSIFTLTCSDASAVLGVAAGFDRGDDFSVNSEEIPSRPRRLPDSFRVGIPKPDQLRFFGDAAAEGLYGKSADHLKTLGGSVVEIDFEPFARCGALLYEGPWLAERLAATQKFIERSPQALLPLTLKLIQSGAGFDAVSAFKGTYTLQALRRKARAEWDRMDVLLLPTTGTIYTRAQIESDPLRLNSNLGYYTNFVNLMDLTALAVPAGFGPSGLPYGVTLMAPAGNESALLDMGDRLHRKTSTTLGVTSNPIPEQTTVPVILGGSEGPDPSLPPRVTRSSSGDVPKMNPSTPMMIRLAVVGAHLSGQPLNHQLTSLEARLVRSCRTSPHYRLYALPGTTPPKPGLIRTSSGGNSIEIEVWEMTPEAFGRFVAAIPAPLGIGTIELEDKELVKSFLCESYAVEGAEDISRFGGWRSFLTSCAGH